MWENGRVYQPWARQLNVTCHTDDVTLMTSSFLLAVAQSVDEFLVLGSSLDIAPGDVIDKVARTLRVKANPECRGLSGGAAIEILARWVHAYLSHTHIARKPHTHACTLHAYLTHTRTLHANLTNTQIARTPHTPTLHAHQAHTHTRTAHEQSSDPHTNTQVERRHTAHRCTHTVRKPHAHTLIKHTHTHAHIVSGRPILRRSLWCARIPDSHTRSLC